jgi:NAD(P)-dependent dehydrogenase (short-subunit alcohol dehydrogenase family)
MITTNEIRTSAAPMAGWLSAANALLFAFGAMLLGGAPLGPLTEQAIPQAMAVQVVCAVLLAAAAIAVLMRAQIGRALVWVASTAALAAVVIGNFAMGFGPSEFTPARAALHIAMVTLAIAAIWALKVRRNA